MSEKFSTGTTKSKQTNRPGKISGDMITMKT